MRLARLAAGVDARVPSASRWRSSGSPPRERASPTRRRLRPRPTHAVPRVPPGRGLPPGLATRRLARGRHGGATLAAAGPARAADPRGAVRRRRRESRRDDRSGLLHAPADVVGLTPRPALAERAAARSARLGPLARGPGRLDRRLDPDAPRDETIDLDRVFPPLCVRGPAPGDRFEPLGMAGREHAAERLLPRPGRSSRRTGADPAASATGSASSGSSATGSPTASS